MSELNNEKDNIVDPHLKKKGGAGLLIFFIILYMIIAAFVTFYNIRTNSYYQMGLIDYFKKHGTIPQFDILYKAPDEATNNAIAKNTANVEPVIQRTNVRDRYFKNNIKIEEIEDSYGSQVKLNRFDQVYYQGNVTYVQISGLKDKDIENKINTAIKNKVLEKVYKYLDDESILRFNVSTYVYGNYSNLLSVNVDTTITYPEVDEYGYNVYSYDNDYLNFRLDTGDTFKLKEVFTPDASIRSILSQAIYKQLAWDYTGKFEFDYGNLDEIDYSDIESKTFLALSGLTQEDLEDLPFYLYDSSVMIIVKDKYFGVDYIDYSDFINIYNIAKTDESIFEEGDLPKRDFVFLNSTLNDAIFYDKVGNNAFAVVFGQSNFDYRDENDNDEDLNAYIEKTVIPYIKKYSDSDKGYIYSITATHYPNYQDGGDTFDMHGYILEMDKKDFNDKVVEDILYKCLANAYESGELYLSILYYNDRVREEISELPDFVTYDFSSSNYYDDSEDEKERARVKEKGGSYWIRDEVPEYNSSDEEEQNI